jgi:hypothetical protein
MCQRAIPGRTSIARRRETAPRRRVAARSNGSPT